MDYEHGAELRQDFSDDRKWMEFLKSYSGYARLVRHEPGGYQQEVLDRLLTDVRVAAGVQPDDAMAFLEFCASDRAVNLVGEDGGVLAVQIALGNLMEARTLDSQRAVEAIQTVVRRPGAEIARNEVLQAIGLTYEAAADGPAPLQNSEIAAIMNAMSVGLSAAGQQSG